MIYDLEAELWLYPAGAGSWCFVTVLSEISPGPKSLRGPARILGSIRVVAGIGQTQCRTSGFPDATRGAFILPVKADVRRRRRRPLASDP